MKVGTGDHMSLKHDKIADLVKLTWKKQLKN